MIAGWRLVFLCCIALGAAPLAFAQGDALTVPKIVEAGAAFSIHTNGSGDATLYIVGPSHVLRRTIQLGGAINFPSGSISAAGRYVVIVKNDASQSSQILDVKPSSEPADLSFLAKPSRLQVGLHGGITGAVYVFDAYGNLITAPSQVSFQLSSPSGNVQTRSATSSDGVAWTAMDSTAQQGNGKFAASIGAISKTRIIEQIPGDPCELKMTAQPSGRQLELETAPVRDCNGNAVPDGTVVTFTMTYNGQQSTVDVPLKRGIAKVQMPVHSGATISVASGVVSGNQIRWEK